MYAHCDECGSEIEPVEGALVVEWRCPSCGMLDPADYGSRCEEAPLWRNGGDNLVCPKCIDSTDDWPVVVASRV